MKMIQEENTTADNSIKTKRRLMKHRHRVESSAQGPSLSDRQRGKAANDHSNAPSPRSYEATAVSHTSEMQRVSNGRGDGKGSRRWDPVLNKESVHVLWFEEVTQAPKEDQQIVGLFAASLR